MPVALLGVVVDELHVADVQVELFLELSARGAIGRLARIDVAAGKTPYGITPASLAGMYDEEVPVTINEDAASGTKRTVCGAGSAERLQGGFRRCG